VKVKTTELKATLDKIKPAIKQNDISEFGQYIYITNGHFVSYNGAICVLTKTDLDLDVALPANEFLQFTNRITAKEISFEVGDTIEIKSGRAKANFAVNSDILKRVDKLNINVPSEFKPLPEDFIKGVKLVRHSVGADKTQEHLTYLKVEGNTLASTDNFRVSEYTMESEMQAMKLPQAVLEHLIKYDFTDYQVDGNVAYFKDGETYFMTRLGEVEFVEYEYLFDVEGVDFVFPDNILNMLSVANITTDGFADIDKTVTIKIKDGIITISSKNDIGSVEIDETVDTKVEASMIVNSQFIEDILNVTKKAVISENLILFKTEKLKQVVALFWGAGENK
jgi:hypothetical protein